MFSFEPFSECWLECWLTYSLYGSAYEEKKNHKTAVAQNTRANVRKSAAHLRAKLGAFASANPKKSARARESGVPSALFPNSPHSSVHNSCARPRETSQLATNRACARTTHSACIFMLRSWFSFRAMSFPCAHARSLGKSRSKTEAAAAII